MRVPAIPEEPKNLRRKYDEESVEADAQDHRHNNHRSTGATCLHLLADEAGCVGRPNSRAYLSVPQARSRSAASSKAFDPQGRQDASKAVLRLSRRRLVRTIREWDGGYSGSSSEGEFSD